MLLLLVFRFFVCSFFFSSEVGGEENENQRSGLLATL